MKENVTTITDRFDAREDFMERSKGKRWCYYVSEIKDETGEYRPSIVIEGEPGRYPLDYTWGTELSLAQRAARDKNEAMGIDRKTAAIIVASSMAVTR